MCVREARRGEVKRRGAKQPLAATPRTMNADHEYDPEVDPAHMRPTKMNKQVGVYDMSNVVFSY